MTSKQKLLLFGSLAAIAGLIFLSKPAQGHILEGGKGDELAADDVDPNELMMGIEVEMEHTNDRKIAEEIAMDHLAEDPNYYTKLSTIHQED